MLRNLNKLTKKQDPKYHLNNNNNNNSNKNHHNKYSNYKFKQK